jgi:hypothetical protein
MPRPPLIKFYLLRRFFQASHIQLTAMVNTKAAGIQNALAKKYRHPIQHSCAGESARSTRAMLL